MLHALAVAIDLDDGVANHGAVERCGRGPGSNNAKEQSNNDPAGERHVLDGIAGRAVLRRRAFLERLHNVADGQSGRVYILSHSSAPSLPRSEPHAPAPPGSAVT